MTGASAVEAEQANFVSYPNTFAMQIHAHGVICTEIVEKFVKCPACKGNGFLEKIEA